MVPAAAARNVARGTRSYLVWSVAVAFLAGAGGLGVSTRFLVPTGGAVVLAVSAIFFLTLAARSILRRHARMTALPMPSAASRFEPPSARAELAQRRALRMVIVHRRLDVSGDRQRDLPGCREHHEHLLPFQALIQDRPPIEQRMFRELQEGLLEAETRRADRGAWPAVSSLAADGIPPFALDPTAKGGRYEWHLTTSGTLVNYLGLPQRSDVPGVAGARPGTGAGSAARSRPRG